MKDFIIKHKSIIGLIGLGLLVICLLCALVTQRTVCIDSAYYSKEDVALYLIKYHELPSNYFVASPNDSRTYDCDMYGGFIHLYDTGKLPASLENSHFQECDVYTDSYSLSNRGKERLVFTTNTRHVRVFYTNDHYTSYTELTEWNINLASHIFMILFWILLVILAFGFIFIFLKNKNIPLLKKRFKSQNKDDVIDITL